MSLLDGLSGALTTATNAASAQQQGKLQGNQIAMGLMLRQAQMEKERAETEQAFANARHLTNQDNPDLRGRVAGAVAQATGELPKNTAEATHLTNQDNPQLQGQLAGARAQAEVGPHVEQAVKTAEGEVAPHVEQATQISHNTLGDKIQEMHARVQAESLGARMQQATARQFIGQNKPLVDTALPYAQTKSAFTEARAGNPAALKSSLISFASVADPKAQLRQGVMNYVTQVDPSFRGTFEMALDRLTSGKLPPEVIDNMEKLVDRIHSTNAAIYRQRRDAFLSRNPLAEQFVPTPDEIFTVPSTSSAPTAAPSNQGGSVRAKYGITPSVP